MYFQGFFLRDDYSLDLKTFQVQQSQDPVLRTVYSWMSRNEKPEFLTPPIIGNIFLHAYYKRFKQLFIDTTTNLISLYITNPFLLKHTLFQFQNYYTVFLEFVSPLQCSKLYLTTYMTILIQVSK